MKSTHKIIIIIGTILIFLGLVMFMYGIKETLRIYLIIGGLILIGISLFTSVIDGVKISSSPKKVNYNYIVKKCPKCFAIIDNDSLFCKKCGSKIDDEVY